MLKHHTPAAHITLLIPLLAGCLEPEKKPGYTVCTEEPWSFGVWEDSAIPMPNRLAPYDDIPFNAAIEAAVVEIKDRANACFKEKDYEGALALYTEADDLSESQRVRTFVAQTPWKYPIEEHTRRMIYSNRAAVYLAQGRFHGLKAFALCIDLDALGIDVTGKYVECIKDCDEALMGCFPMPPPPTIRKAGYRRAQALIFLGRLEEAQTAVEIMLQLDADTDSPVDPLFVALGETVKARIAQRSAKNSAKNAGRKARKKAAKMASDA